MSETQTKKLSEATVVQSVADADKIPIVNSSGQTALVPLSGLLGAVKVGGKNLTLNTRTYGESANDGTYRGLGVYTSSSYWTHPPIALSEPLVIGETYILSYYVKGNAHYLSPLNFATTGSGNVWERKAFIFKATNEAESCRVCKGVGHDPGEPLSVCGIKVERGNIPTDWTPAPEDWGGVKLSLSAVCAFAAQLSREKGGSQHERYADQGADERGDERNTFGYAGLSRQGYRREHDKNSGTLFYASIDHYESTRAYGQIWYSYGLKIRRAIGRYSIHLGRWPGNSVPYEIKHSNTGVSENKHYRNLIARKEVAV